jgi:hypothetical protein
VPAPAGRLPQTDKPLFMNDCLGIFGLRCEIFALCETVALDVWGPTFPEVVEAREQLHAMEMGSWHAMRSLISPMDPDWYGLRRRHVAAFRMVPQWQQRVTLRIVTSTRALRHVVGDDAEAAYDTGNRVRRRP